MNSEDRPRTNPAVVFREVSEGDAVLVNLDTAASLALNPTGSMIWQLIDGQRTIEEIVTAVRQRFSDPPPRVGDDVVTLLEILAEDGFIGFLWNADKKNEKKRKTEK